MKGRAVRTFVRSFFVTALCGLCLIGLLLGIYQADARMRAETGKEALTVFKAREVKGGYEIEVLGRKAVLGAEWIPEAREYLKDAALALPPKLRFLLELCAPRDLIPQEIG